MNFDLNCLILRGRFPITSWKKIRLSANDRTPVDCTSVVAVADGDDAAAASVVDDGAGDRERPLDGSLAGVTRETCCSADGSCHLPKRPRPAARVSSKMRDEGVLYPRNAL